MGRTRTPKSIPKSIESSGKPKIYAEGKHDYDYLTALAKNHVVLQYTKGTKLQASAVKFRIEEIKRDITDEAIECIIWIVDGGDQHIKNSRNFVKFYKEWRTKKEHAWNKLHILINAPCLEYWFLLHRTNPLLDNKGVPTFFEDANALLDSDEFKKYCSEGKGANLIKAVVSDITGRNQAIERAKELNNQLSNLAEKNLLNVARAEMYQIFEIIKVEKNTIV